MFLQDVDNWVVRGKKFGPTYIWNRSSRVVSVNSVSCSKLSFDNYIYWKIVKAQFFCVLNRFFLYINFYLTKTHCLIFVKDSLRKNSKREIHKRQKSWISQANTEKVLMSGLFCVLCCFISVLFSCNLMFLQHISVYVSNT